ncbi:MAG: aminopeptidase P family protein [Helicobacter sp.]|nr:aminopeptidase P family protein [Helicobacter sp.]
MNKLEQLQSELKKANLDIALIPMSDPHLCEYIPDFYKSIAYISGFSGSAGIVVVGLDFAHLWTDGRYFVQAEAELKGSGFSLQKQIKGASYLGFLSNLAKTREVRVGVDFALISIAQKDALFDIFKHNLIDIDLISNIWQNRPALPQNEIYSHDIKFAIQSPKEKLSKIQEIMRKNGAKYHLISSLEDIAFICNLRGSDIEFNPLFLSYLLISETRTELFVRDIRSDLADILRQNDIFVRKYDELESALSELKDGAILLDPARTSIKIANYCKIPQILTTNPSVFLKSQKCPKISRHISNCMQSDGVALVKFNMWLEDALKQNESLSELDIAPKLAFYRAQDELYIGESFGAIVGFKANGALPHYRATPKSFAKISGSGISGSGLLLIDSGGQYQNGTTDITRVFPVGEITQEEKRDYTLVLKAHIALARAKFPFDLPSPLLDGITRAPLWSEGIDYAHGTGHGVGYFLNVHEAPQVISTSAMPLLSTKMKLGMVTSNEPGIYREGKWGVRLENLVLNVPRSDLARPITHFLAEDVSFDNEPSYLEFSTLTLFPFERACIDAELLTKEEKDWLNGYHKEVFLSLSPKLLDAQKEWLKAKTAAIN